MSQEQPGVEIVEGGLEDVETVFAITRAVFHDHGDGTAPVEPRSEQERTELEVKLRRLHKRIEEHAATIFLAQVDGRSVGFSIGYESEPGLYYYWLSAVLAEHRRRGIGKLLLHAQIDDARQREFDAIWFAADNEAVDMIIMGLHEGFRIVKAEYSAQHECVMVHMQKALK
ncbi:MAG: GNAT family N-acetyltransferase [Armatimonadota bacterium]